MADGAHGAEERAKFTAMTEGTLDDWMTTASGSSTVTSTKLRS